jgi:hypothetical protein
MERSERDLLHKFIDRDYCDSDEDEHEDEDDYGPDDEDLEVAPEPEGSDDRRDSDNLNDE